jgi:hypothetical protein
MPPAAKGAAAPWNPILPLPVLGNGETVVGVEAIIRDTPQAWRR